MITIENADKALKDYYLQAVTAQLNEHISPFYTAIEKSTANVVGKDVKLAVIRGGTHSVRACTETDDLPKPFSNRYLEISVPLKNIYGTIEITDKAMRASRDSAGAFVNLVNAEMEGLIADAQFNFQRMLFGDGNGRICKMTGRSDGKDTIKVDSAKSWFIGMNVDVYPQDGSTTYGGNMDLYVVDVDEEEKTVTFDKELEGTFKDGYVAVHGAKNNELTGLAAIFEGATLYNYEKTSESFFKPYRTTIGSSVNFKEEVLTDLIDELEERRSSKINIILCSYKTRKMIADLIANEKRVVNTIDANTGYGAVTVNGIPVYADKFCPDNVVYFLNTDDFVLSQLCDWEWLEDEDGKILKQIPGKAAYSATLVKYAELICKKPYAQARLVIGS